jgi:hypothetical protein
MTAAMATINNNSIIIKPKKEHFWHLSSYGEILFVICWANMLGTCGGSPYLHKPIRQDKHQILQPEQLNNLHEALKFQFMFIHWYVHVQIEGPES